VSIDIGSINASQSGAVDAQANQLLKNAKSTAHLTGQTSVQSATSASAATKLDAKTEKAGKDFESILLGSWLQGAQHSFASVPGGDEDDDDDSSKDQFQGMAMQQLAGSLTASGGIGIAKMITQHLRSAADSEQQKNADKSTTSTKINTSA